MTPIWFGSPARFGLIHPAIGAARDCGIVLCNPLGYESLCTHRSLFDLAVLLAQAGFAVLRFDYAGAGDSAGTDADPERVPAWLESVDLAATELAQRTGVSQLAFFGLRLGGTLALTAAQHRPDVKAVATWAAPAKGRAYVRELRAFTMIQGAQAATGDLESSGFLMTAQTMDAVSKLDLLATKTAPAHTLLLSKDEAVSGEERLAAHLSTLGSKSEHAFVAGYDAMMLDAHDATVPDAVWSKVVNWFTTVFPPSQSAVVPAPLVIATKTQISPTIAEQPFMFGSDDTLFGLLSEPTTANNGDVAVLLLNTGSNHHIGPHRMAVVLARQLADAKLPAFRFDVGGLGDSAAHESAQENRLYSLSSLPDVKAAMSLLQAERGYTRFVLVGLCSGAYLTWQTAKVDARVVGQVLINLQTFQWHEGDSLEVTMRQSYKSTQFYRSALLKPEVWTKLFRGEVNWKGIALKLVDRARRRAMKQVVAAGRFMKHGTTDTDVARMFKQMDARGMETLLVFGSNDGGLDTIAEHLGSEAGDMRGHQRFSCVILDDADHTFTDRAKRDQLTATITAHLSTRFAH